MAYIIEDKNYPDEPIIATRTRADADTVNTRLFDGEAEVREVNDDELQDEGFNPSEVK